MGVCAQSPLPYPFENAVSDREGVEGAATRRAQHVDTASCMLERRGCWYPGYPGKGRE